MLRKIASLFSKPARSETSEAEMAAIAEATQRIADVVIESIKIAKSSVDAGTRLSRLRIAKENLDLVKAEAARFSFLRIPNLAGVELDIQQLEFEANRNLWSQMAIGNQKGIAAEAAGDVDVALAEYERLVDLRADTPHTYNRLAVIYRKLGKPEDEVRVIRAGLDNIAPIAVNHLQKLRERLPVAERRLTAQKVKALKNAAGFAAGDDD